MSPFFKIKIRNFFCRRCLVSIVVKKMWSAYDNSLTCEVLAFRNSENFMPFNLQESRAQDSPLNSKARESVLPQRNTIRSRYTLSCSKILYYIWLDAIWKILWELIINPPLLNVYISITKGTPYGCTTNWFPLYILTKIT